MLQLSLSGIGNRVIRKLKRNPDRFLKRVSGIVHVGANTGQERETYARLGIRALWIEPIPEIFRKLSKNLEPFPDQRAIQGLITDEDDASCEFHIANNDGASSSILELNEHKDIWPEVNYTRTIRLTTVTLASLFNRHAIDPSDYQALLLDTQGAELLVLKGSVPLLNGFTYIKTEAADFESYKGCCQLAEIEDFMKAHGYAEFSRSKFASRRQGGNYYDIVYERQG